MTQELEQLTEDAASRIKSLEHGERIRIISHYDADGITAAAIISLAVQRAGYQFHVTLMRNPFYKGLARLKEEQNNFIIFTDMGSGQIEYIESLNTPSLIIDHHQVVKQQTPDHILQINANLCGINGNHEACGATLTYAVAKALNPNNTDLSSLALAGATGDKQYIGGFTGYNKRVIDDAIQQGIVTSFTGLKLEDTALKIAISHSIEPFFPGYSGHTEETKAFLHELHIDPNSTYSQLSDEKRKTLHSSLLLLLLKRGCESNILETVVRERYIADQTFGELERCADILDACGKFGRREIGLAVCFGDQQAYQKALLYEKEFKQEVLQELLTIEKEGIKQKKTFRFFYAKNSSLGGVIGGIAINFLLDKKKPLLSIVRKTDELHISCRGNQFLVNNGLDLGSAMNQVAKDLDGHGGGHKIAAGATIPLKHEEQFLKGVDMILTKQLIKERK